MTDRDLLEIAAGMMKQSYAPYSHFHVGAALLTKSGKVYTGCNIENAAYPATVCAERTAIFKAVSEGETQFESIAIVGGINGEVKDYCAPCGVCRQVMREFCESEFRIILTDSTGLIKECTLDELLPLSFGPENIAE